MIVLIINSNQISTLQQSKTASNSFETQMEDYTKNTLPSKIRDLEDAINNTNTLMHIENFSTLAQRVDESIKAITNQNKKWFEDHMQKIQEEK